MSQITDDAIREFLEKRLLPAASTRRQSPPPVFGDAVGVPAPGADLGADPDFNPWTHIDPLAAETRAFAQISQAISTLGTQLQSEKAGRIEQAADQLVTRQDGEPELRYRMRRQDALNKLRGANGLPPIPLESSNERDLPLTEEIRRGLERGTASIAEALTLGVPQMGQAGLAAGSRLTGQQWLADFAEKNVLALQQMRERSSLRSIQQNLPPSQSVQGALPGDIRDLPRFLAARASEVAPQLALSVASGGIGGAAARGIGASSNAGRVAGFSLTGGALEADDVFRATYEQTGNATEAFVEAALYGTIATAIERFPAEQIVGGGRGGVRAIRRTIQAAAAEGGTEAAQSIAQTITRNLIGTPSGISFDEAVAQALGEGLVGAAVGGAAGGIRGVGEAATRPRETARQSEPTTPAIPVASPGIVEPQTVAAQTPVNTPSPVADSAVANGVSTETPVTTQTPVNDPSPPVTERPKGTEFSRAAMEREILAAPSVAEQMDALADTTRDESAVSGEVSLSFTGSLPGEIRTAIEGRPELRRFFRTNQPNGAGEDTLAELGADRMVEIAEQLIGRTSRGMEIASELGNFDPRTAYLANAVATQPIDSRPKYEALNDPAALAPETTFTVNGEPFRVATDELGVLIVEGNGLYLDAAGLGRVPIDRGSLNEPLSTLDTIARREAAPAEDDVSFLPGLGDPVSVESRGSPKPPSQRAFVKNLPAQKQRRVAELENEIRKSQSTLFTGIDPSLVAKHAQLFALYSEAGVRTFANFARLAVESIGEQARPVLRAAYRQFIDNYIPEGQRDQYDNPDQVDAAPDALIDQLIAEPIKTGADKGIQEALADVRSGVAEGRPDLANPATTPEGQRFVSAVDTLREDAPTPRQSFGDVFEQAEQQVTQDTDGVRSTLLEKWQRGEPLTDAETAAARVLLERTETIDMSNRDAVLDRVKLLNAYRESGTEAARSLSIRRASLREGSTPAERATQYKTDIHDLLTTPNMREQRRINNLRRQIDELTSDADKATIQARIDKIMEKVADRSLKGRTRLARYGIDLDTMTAEDFGDLRKRGQIVRILSRSLNPSDWIMEYWYNAILSAPTTHAANLTGNSLALLWEMGIQRQGEALANLALRDKDLPSFGENKAVAKAVVYALGRGMHMAAATYQSELPAFETLHGQEAGGSKIEINERGPKIPGTPGRVIRIPGRALLAEDQMFRTFAAIIQTAAIAHRKGKANGLKGDALAQYVREQTTTPDSDTLAEALEFGRLVTYTQEPGKYVKWFNNFRDMIPVIRFVIPFVTTPVQIAKFALRKGPLGTPKAAWSLIRAIRTPTTAYKSDAVRRIVEQMSGLAVMSILMAAVDDDDPWITGSPGTQRGERDMAYRTAPPYSIRLGDKWVSYQRLEPISTMLTVAVDTAKSLRRVGSGDTTQSAELARYWETSKSLVRDKTFLSGLSDILYAIEYNDATRLAVNFGSSWTPNALKHAVRANDPYIREQKVWGDDTINKSARRIAYGLWPTAGNAPPPKQDLWGRDVKKGPKPISDYLWTLLSPVDVRTPQVARPDIAITNWNTQNPDEPFAPTSMQPYVTIKGERKYLTDQQYANMLKDAGSRALNRLNRANLNTSTPTARDIDIINRVLQQERKAARVRMTNEIARSSR